MPSTKGTYEIKAGDLFSLTIVSKTQPYYVDAAPSPVAPHGGIYPFTRIGSIDGVSQWRTFFSLGSTPFNTWDVGVQVKGRLYVVHVELT